MKLCALALFALLVTGCNVLPVQYQDGSHWAILEKPLSQKCVEVKADDARIGTVGLMSLFSGTEISGTNLTYKSWGKMCAPMP